MLRKDDRRRKEMYSLVGYHFSDEYILIIL